MLILDDVFAELDARRREQLVGVAVEAEQVLITAAVDDDLPENLAGRLHRRFNVEMNGTGNDRMSRLVTPEEVSWTDDGGADPGTAD